MHSADLDNQKVVVYTDGACSGNPGHGGYGCVMLYKKDNTIHRKELSQGYRLTTNNRMEMLGVIRALEALKKPSSVVVYSDSKYVIDAIKKGWLISWKKKGWINSQKKPVKNRDLWELFDKQLNIHDIKFVWVRGHAGVHENEVCDTLAVEASKSNNLIEDKGYNGSDS
jgi:ribonuclease HI